MGRRRRDSAEPALPPGPTAAAPNTARCAAAGLRSAGSQGKGACPSVVKLDVGAGGLRHACGRSGAGGGRHKASTTCMAHQRTAHSANARESRPRVVTSRVPTTNRPATHAAKQLRSSAAKQVRRETLTAQEHALAGADRRHVALLIKPAKAHCQKSAQ